MNNHKYSKIHQDIRRTSPYLRHLIIFSFFLLAGFLSLPYLLFADTIVDSHITQDTTWDKNGRPYIITANIQVYGTETVPVTLSIEPGVEIRFEADKQISLSASELYLGALQAIGTEQEPIIFTSANTTSPSPGDWWGIHFPDHTVDAQTIMEHCIVAYAGSAGAGHHLPSVPSPETSRNRTCHSRRSRNGFPGRT